MNYDRKNLPSTEVVTRTLTRLASIPGSEERTHANVATTTTLATLWALCVVRDAEDALDAERRETAARETEARREQEWQAALERARGMPILDALTTGMDRLSAAPARTASIVLGNAGIVTVADLAARRRVDVMRLRAVGGQTVRALEAAMARAGIRWLDGGGG